MHNPFTEVVGSDAEDASLVGRAINGDRRALATNEGAIRLWESLGFETVGRLPLAFPHPRHGYTDALVMFRVLQ